MEERDAEWQIYAHDPELGAAREIPVGRVSQEDLDQVYVKEARRRDGQWHVSHADVGYIAVADEPDDSGEEQQRPDDDQAGVGFAQAVPVDYRTPITTFRTEPHSDGIPGFTKGSPSGSCEK